MRSALRARLAHTLRFPRNTQGSVALLTALMMVPLLVAAGGAVDFTQYYNARETIQTALDASVLAGAAADNNDTIARKTFTSWHVAIHGELQAPHYNSSETGEASLYRGAVQAQLKTSFLPLIGIRTLRFTATATAERTKAAQAGGSLCLKLRNPYATPGLNVNGGTIQAPNCEIDVDSTSSSAVIFDRTVTAEKICVAGPVWHVNRPPEHYYTRCTPQADPYARAGALPKEDASACAWPSYDVNYNNNGAPVTVPEGEHCGRLNFSGGHLTLYPGIYGGGINFNNSPHVTFMPGVYIIKNASWYLNGGTYSGTGVTFYFADGNFLQFNNNARANFSAPTSGDTRGILMYEADYIYDNSWSFNMSGTLSGAIHLPSRNVIFNSSSPIYARGLWVFNSMISSTTLHLESDPESATDSAYSTPHLIR